jgi:DNA topoisomerase-2
LDELVSGPGSSGSGSAAAESKSEVASAAKVLKSFQEAYNDVDVEFLLTLDSEYFHEARTFPAEFEKKFRLVNSTTLTNMVAFDCDGHIRRFGSAGAILESFYVKRIGGYVSRKASELARLDAFSLELDARVRFVKAVVAGTLVVSNAEDADLLAGLKAHSLPALSAPVGAEADDLRGYEYLLRMRVDRLKASAIAELEKELAATRKTRDILAAKSAEDLWLADLDVFSVEYETFAASKAHARTATASGAPVKAKKAAAKRVVKPKAKA